MEIDQQGNSDSVAGDKLTFRQCLDKIGADGKYQRQLLILMTGYWIISSFFLDIPFFLFKKPIYIGCKQQQDNQCIQDLCNNFPDTIINHVQIQNTLTYQFHLFCNLQPLRLTYKITPQFVSLIGLLIYGVLADLKGRAIAFKISWRLFTVGLVIFSSTQTPFLITFGYLLASVNCFPSLIIQFVLLFEQTARNMRIRACLFILASLFIGPLVLSLSIEPIISAIGIRLSLVIFCALPALILSLFINRIKQSVSYTYKDDKIMAFNILNVIARINGKAPILVDLGKSTWVKHKRIDLKLTDFLIMPKIRTKLYVGIFFITTIYFNIKASQTSLDIYTDTHLRNILMNIATTAADLTLCFLVLSIRRTSKYLSFAGLIVLIVRLFIIIFANQYLIAFSVTILSMAVRYISQISYGILLIWSIETFPTICRARCCSMVMCGCSIGIFLAYSLKQFPLILLILGIVLTICTLYLQRFINLNNNGKLYDTLDKQYYYKNDYFISF